MQKVHLLVNEIARIMVKKLILFIKEQFNTAKGNISSVHQAIIIYTTTFTIRPFT